MIHVMLALSAKMDNITAKMDKNKLFRIRLFILATCFLEGLSSSEGDTDHSEESKPAVFREQKGGENNQDNFNTNHAEAL